MQRQPFLIHCFVLVICRNSKTGKYLCVKEILNKGWWVVGGHLEPGENFTSAAIRETKKEAGIDINLKGILRIEHTLHGTQTARLRVVFYAVSNCEIPKQISDSDSECANWFDVEEIKNLQKIKPGLRGPEVLEWPLYIERGGDITSLDLLQKESDLILDSSIYQSIKFTKEQHYHIYLNSLKKYDTNTITNLIENGMDCDVVINDENWTGLHFSIKSKNENMVKCFLINGADPKLQTKKKRNSFHLAMKSSFKILKMLLLQISDLDNELQLHILNSQDVKGDTPLHILSRELIKYQMNDLSVFNYLKKYGADSDILNYDGYSPTQLLKSQFSK